FARTHMTFEITQLWGQITGSSLQVQMFTSEPQTLRSAPLFLYGPTTVSTHGLTAHEDFCGQSGQLKPRDLQVMHSFIHLQPLFVSRSRWVLEPIPAHLLSCTDFSFFQGPDQKQQKVEPPHTVVFGDGDSVKIQNNDFGVSHFLSITGEPINQPATWYVSLSLKKRSPFVMTTEEEVEQAIRDYQRGQNGFQRAINWRSKIRVSS
uniref:Pirin n=1 Tax=Echeneis naucrates TaxID=173247 RepID=A0A665VWA4_ECHNA